jgi:hypothetical protein
VSRDFIQPPQIPADGLAAKLLRQGNALRFGLAVGVIGSDRQPEPVIHADDHGFDLSAAVGT